MKEMDKEEFIHKILKEGCTNIDPVNIVQSLICAVLDALHLPNYSIEDKRAKIESAIINNIRPAIERFEHLQQLYEMLWIQSDLSFFNLLKNKGFCNDYLFLDKEFENPYPDETSKYKMFQGTPAEWLSGMRKIEDLEPHCTPVLPFSALISQIEILQRELFDTDSDKVLYDIRALLSSLQIFLVTNNLEGKEHKVINPFDGKEYITKIPQSNKDYESGSDALGMYVPKYGIIYLWVDKIYAYRSHPLIFQKVLLHELIHFLFDIVRRSKVEGCNTKGKNYDEETMDNLLVLYMYKNAISPIKNGEKKAFSEIKDFISNQPYVYRSAITVFEQDSDWFSTRENLYNFLKK